MIWSELHGDVESQAESETTWTPATDVAGGNREERS
jgi:hypothetical protein